MKSVPEPVLRNASGFYYEWQWRVFGGFCDRICWLRLWQSLTVVTESVTESVFSKDWDHSYKHDSFIITGSEGGESVPESVIGKASGLTRYLIGNVKCNWVLFE